MSAPTYRVQVRMQGEDWRMVLGGVQSCSVAVKAAQKEAAKLSRIGQGPHPLYAYVRVTLGDLVVASWTNGKRDLRGGEA